MSFLSDIASGIGNAFSGTFSFVSGWLGDVLGRIVGLPGFGLDLLGIQTKKYMRVRFVILADLEIGTHEGGALIAQTNIEETFKLTKSILEQANIELIHSGIITAGSAPNAALNVPPKAQSFGQNWTEAGAYFNALAGIGWFTRRLSVIIVNTIEGDEGRSFGPSVNYVLVESEYFDDPKDPSSLVAHEIGHACGLLHRDTKTNLMRGEGRTDTQLSRWQCSFMRGSKFVWYF